MKKSTWRKQHKWFGLILAFFIFLFCLSGIVLNHPALFSNINVSRSLLPSDYEYQHWNRGLLRGSLPWQEGVLIYGNGGIWLTDRNASTFRDLNRGLPLGADHQNIRSVVHTDADQLFAAGQYGLYVYTDSAYWSEVPLPKKEEERLTDMVFYQDTLIVLGRSFLYFATAPYTQFQKLMLEQPDDYDGKVPLFRTVWLLHSGELFGWGGKIVVDLIAVAFVFISLTGVLYWFLPKVRKRTQCILPKLFRWHNAVGKWTIVVTLALCITGWFLRPPALIAIASGRIPPIPFSSLDSPNPWHDKLRTLRRDRYYNDWLLYTSNGFYTLSNFSASPRAVQVAQPPISVMGINAQVQDSLGTWLVGSFSGMFLWDRSTGATLDYFTYEPAQVQQGIPIAEHAIAGYSTDIGNYPFTVDYNKGTEQISMPTELVKLPMSLRSAALEVHTGRIFTFLGKGGILFIFFMGLAIFWTLWTGWKRRR